MTIKAERLEETAAHRERLIAVFGNGEGWDHNGEVSDAGPDGQAKCACGHPIRYQYHWTHRDGRTAITGSVCVDYVPGLNPEAVARIKAHAAELRKAEAKARAQAKRAAEAAEVAEFRAALEADVAAYVAGHEWTAGAWRLRDGIRGAGSLKTPKGQLARLRKVRELLERWQARRAEREARRTLY